MLYAVRLLDRRTELLATDETLQQAFDPYAVVRNAYVKRREYLVRDGNLPEETYDDPATDVPPAAASPAPQAQPAEPPAGQPPPEAPKAPEGEPGP